MHVGAESGQWWPQLPQLRGSSYVSTHCPPQQTCPVVQSGVQGPASMEPPLLEPLELPELLPLLEPLEPPELLPLLEPLEPPELLPLLEPLEPPELLPLLEPLELPELPPLLEPLELPPPEPLELPEPLLDEPLPPPELPPLAVASTDASGGGLLSESDTPPQRVVRIIRPARPAVATKEERIIQPPRGQA
jgi:hypothetical protein